MNAQTLNCFSCGAAVSSDAPNCEHCGARLATVSCPSCFGMMFLGSKFCPHCGGQAVDWQSEGVEKLCPSCQAQMLRGTLGEIRLHECGKCYGLWVDTATFELICRNSEHQAAVLGDAQAMVTGIAALGPVRYVKCPECRELMHRVNFARCSGVVVDVCREHGTWFDQHELHRIVQFIRAGGLDLSRERQKTALEREHRKARAARMESTGGYRSSDSGNPLESRVRRRHDRHRFVRDRRPCGRRSVELVAQTLVQRARASALRPSRNMRSVTSHPRQASVMETP
jgi:Zn-finger nucleic acid-binding protein